MDRGAWWVTAQRVAKRQTQTEVTACTHADKLKRIVVNFPHQVALVFFLSLNAPLRWRGNQQFVVWETKGSHHECFATYVVDFMDTRQFVIVHVFNIHTNFTFWGIWILVCYINYQRLFILCFKKKNSYNQNVSIILYSVWGKYFRSLGMQDLSFLSRGRTQTPLQWKFGLLTTRSPTEQYFLIN